MAVIINGVGIGFFAAFFISLYAEFLFNYVLPFIIIYGIIAPFLTAIAIGVQLVWAREKAKHDNIYGYEESPR